MNSFVHNPVIPAMRWSKTMRCCASMALGRTHILQQQRALYRGALRKQQQHSSVQSPSIMATKEEQQPQPRLTDRDVRSQDILLVGRLWSNKQRMHVGSVAFRKFVAAWIPEYLSSAKHRADTMRVIALATNSIVESRGSRILRMIVTGEGGEELDRTKSTSTSPSSTGIKPKKKKRKPNGPPSSYYWIEVDKSQWRTLIGDAIRDKIKAIRRSRTNTLPKPASRKAPSFTLILQATMDELRREDNGAYKINNKINTLETLNVLEQSTARSFLPSSRDHGGETGAQHEREQHEQEEVTPGLSMREMMGRGMQRKRLVGGLVDGLKQPVLTKRIKIDLAQVTEPELPKRIKIDLAQATRTNAAGSQDPQQGSSSGSVAGGGAAAVQNNWVHAKDIRPQDILLGLTPGARAHIGSRAFRAFVASKSNAYIECKEQALGTSVVVALATESIVESGARMLRKVPGGTTGDDLDMKNYWVEVEKSNWYTTTGQAIRYHVWQFKKKKKNENKSNATVFRQNKNDVKYVTQIPSFAAALKQVLKESGVDAEFFHHAATDEQPESSQQVASNEKGAEGGTTSTGGSPPYQQQIDEVGEFSPTEGDGYSSMDELDEKAYDDDSTMRIKPQSVYSSSSAIPSATQEVDIFIENNALLDAAMAPVQRVACQQQVNFSSAAWLQQPTAQRMSMQQFHPSLLHALNPALNSAATTTRFPLPTTVGSSFQTPAPQQQQPMEQILLPPPSIVPTTNTALHHHHDRLFLSAAAQQAAAVLLMPPAAAPPTSAALSASLVYLHREASIRVRVLEEEAKLQRNVAVAAYRRCAEKFG